MKRIFRHTQSVAFSIAMVTLALPAAVRAHDDAEKTFKANCAACHAPDGSGSTAAGKALKAQDLRSPEVQKKSDEDLAELISKGKNKMPAFGKKLKPEEITELVSFIRALAKK